MATVRTAVEDQMDQITFNKQLKPWTPLMSLLFICGSFSTVFDTLMTREANMEEDRTVLLSISPLIAVPRGSQH